MVVAVPATATQVCACPTSTASNAGASVARVNSSASRTCASVGGSSWRNFSATRTQPTFDEYAAATSAVTASQVPVTSSVDPPPTSATTKGPSSGSRSATAPANES